MLPAHERCFSSLNETRMKRLFLLCICLLVAGGAFSQTKFVSQKAGHVYTMAIPDYMVKTYDLNDVATLQYMNEAKEAYVVVIDDEKEQLESLGVKFSNASEFLDFFTKDYNLEAAKRKLGKTKTFSENGVQFAQTEMEWEEEGSGYYMLITAVETKTHYYKVLCWTTTGYKKALRNDYQAIAKSIKD